MVTMIVKATLLQGMLQLPGFVWDVIAMSALGVTVVGSLELLLAALVSPDAATVAVLVTLGTAPAATVTVSVMALLPPAPMEPELVHVTACPPAEQLHPLPAPETKPRPVGSVSVTVVVPLVAADPTF